MTTEVFDCIVCGQTNLYGVRWCENCHKEYTYLPRRLYQLVGALAGSVLYLALGNPQFPGLEATVMLIGSAAIGSGLFSLFAPNRPALKPTGADIFFPSGEVVETYEIDSDNSRNAPEDVNCSVVGTDPLGSSSYANELRENTAGANTDFRPQFNAYKFIIFPFSLLLLIGPLIFMYFDIGRRAENVAVIVERDANLRDGPSTSGTAVVEKLTAGTLLNGRWIEATAPQSGRWLEIVRDGKMLYVWEGNLVHAEPSERRSTMPSAIWQCASISQNLITVTLTEKTYQFDPYNPDGGKLSGSLRPLATIQRHGTEVTEIEFIGSGAPRGRWAFIQTKGKRKALMHYAVETSGDAGECVSPGETNQYVLN